MRCAPARIIPILAGFQDLEMTKGHLSAALNFMGPALVIAFRVQLGCNSESRLPLAGSRYKS